MDNEPKPTMIEHIYPDLSLKGKEEAKDTLHQYLSLVKRIFSRLKAEGKFNEVMKQLRKERENNKSNNAS